MTTLRWATLAPWIGLMVAAGLIVLVAVLDVETTAEAILLAFLAAGVVACIGFIFDQARRAVLDVLSRLRNHVVIPEQLLLDGIEHIYTNRAAADEDIRNALLSQARAMRGHMIACGVSLGGLLHDQKEHSFFKDIDAALRVSGNQALWDVILLDPKCPEARRRGVLESGTNNNGVGFLFWQKRGMLDTEQDIEKSVRHCERLPACVRCSLYKTRPFLFAVITPEVAFEQRYISAPPSAPVPYGRCFGDLTEMLRLRPNSRRYNQLFAELEHFRKTDCARIPRRDANSLQPVENRAV